ncbi:MAG: alpha/beta hydrolase [Thermoproteota archaeon]|nr:alpha/beta hydrolase [Thermoproteota archaeon]
MFLTGILFGQNKRPDVDDFRHLQTIYKGDTVDILIKSKKGEEEKPKPLLLFCQGSLPTPLIIKYDQKGKQGIYNVFVFNTDSLSNDYHLAIIGKPYIPLISEEKLLGPNFTYIDSTGKFPKKYTQRNVLDYYVNRDIEVIEFLQKQNWISKNKLIVCGHSEGSTIAAKLAFENKKVTHLIYANGNPFGRIMSIIGQSRRGETDTDSTRFGEQQFEMWKNVIADSTNMDGIQGDTNKATYVFSIPPIFKNLEQLKIPILVCYGTKDWTAPFNDYLRVEMIRQHRNNFTFKAYIGTEHNYFPIKANGEINYDVFNWDKVADDWRNWLMRQ